MLCCSVLDVLMTNESLSLSLNLGVLFASPIAPGELVRRRRQTFLRIARAINTILFVPFVQLNLLPQLYSFKRRVTLMFVSTILFASQYCWSSWYVKEES